MSDNWYLKRYRNPPPNTKRPLNQVPNHTHTEYEVQLATIANQLPVNLESQLNGVIALAARLATMYQTILEPGLEEAKERLSALEAKSKQ